MESQSVSVQLNSYWISSRLGEQEQEELVYCVFAAFVLNKTERGHKGRLLLLLFIGTQRRPSGKKAAPGGIGGHAGEGPRGS